MELELKIIGVLLVVLALMHFAFAKYFKWKEELHCISLINRQMMQVHTFFIALVVMLMGILCFTSAPELIQTSLGKKISFGLGLFWFIRLLVQFFGYSPKLWKGKKLETIIHIMFSVLWAYFSFIFFKISFSAF